LPSGFSGSFHLDLANRPTLNNHLRVAQSDVFSRVKDDLALGHTHLATQRLRTLIAIEPTNIAARRLLATVYRQTGNLVEAGRWAFLCDAEPRPDELAAFERANPSPFLRLRLLNWPEDGLLLPDDAARERLAALRSEAERVGPPAQWREAPLRPRTRTALLPCLFTVVSLGVISALFGIGAFRLLTWILK
jgi:hypothetical protein